jgi:hypothetical protein
MKRELRQRHATTTSNLLRLKTGILDQTSLTGTRIAPNPDEVTRLRPHTTETRYNEQIINTLLENRAQ